MALKEAMMNARIIFSLVAFAASTPLQAVAGVRVEIVDAPQWVYSYSPIFVTTQVENTGPTAILLPVQRHSIEGGRAVDDLRTLQLGSQCGIGDDLRWLQPGEKFYFQQDVSPWVDAEGQYFVRAVFGSDGEGRIYAPTGKESFRVELGRFEDPKLGRVETWAGRESSPVTMISIRRPKLKADLGALELLQSRHRTIDNHFLRLNAFGSDFEVLLGRFPTSHYTFVAAFAQGDVIKRLNTVLKVQPDHPLKPYALLVSMKEAIQRAHCAAPSVRADLPAIDWEQPNVPKGALPYLRQLEAELRRQPCPPPAP